MDRLIGCLVGWVNWLVDCLLAFACLLLIDWLVCWLVDLIGWLIWFADWFDWLIAGLLLIGWLVDWPIDLIGWLPGFAFFALDWLIASVMDELPHWWIGGLLMDWLIGWLIDWFVDSLIGSLVGWLIYWVCCFARLRWVGWGADQTRLIAVPINCRDDNLVGGLDFATAVHTKNCL